MKRKKKLKRLQKRKIIKAIKWILAFISIFLSLVIIFSTKWTLINCQFDNFDQILFTLNSSVSTASNDIITDFVCKNVLIPLVITILIIIIVIVIKHFFKYIEAYFSIKIKNKVIKLNSYTIINIILVLCLLIYSIYYAMSNLYIFSYIEYSYIESNFLEVNYTDPEEVKLEFPKKKRNLIYIFLESMESTYADKENGGAYDTNYIKELTDLANDNINFSSNELTGGAHMAYNTSWTMAAMVSHTSGIPLKTTFNQDDESTYRKGTTLAGAYSIGEILKEEGYKQYIMVGSDLTFGGRRVYFKNHGNYTVFDYFTAIDDGIIDEDYYVNWGYEDKKMFDYAKEELLKIAENDEPFNFTMLTADTHFPDGHIEKDCKYEYDDHYLNSIACSSKMLKEFIDWIKKQDFYENTTIILAGDHLSMNTYSFDNIDPNYNRSVYNVFINSAVDTNCNKNREFTTFDYYPTTLASLGVKIDGDKLGLGTNLFSCKATLSEEYGNDYIDERLKEKSLFYDECIAKECKKDK